MWDGKGFAAGASWIGCGQGQQRVASWQGDDDRLTFTIEGKELEKLRDWLENHECAAPRPYDNLYPLNMYTFCPTGMSIGVRIYCDRCDKEQNITDSSDW